LIKLLYSFLATLVQMYFFVVVKPTEFVKTSDFLRYYLMWLQPGSSFFNLQRLMFSLLQLLGN
jgi:hypothetical protein